MNASFGNMEKVLTAKIEKEITEWVSVLYRRGIKAPMYVKHSWDNIIIPKLYIPIFGWFNVLYLFRWFNVLYLLFLIIFLTHFILFSRHNFRSVTSAWSSINQIAFTSDGSGESCEPGSRRWFDPISQIIFKKWLMVWRGCCIKLWMCAESWESMRKTEELLKVQN